MTVDRSHHAPMPAVLDVACPSCGERAQFEFAEAVRIAEKKDVRFFRTSAIFEYRRLRDGSGHAWHAALFYPGLHGKSPSALQTLPPGYAAKQWAHRWTSSIGLDGRTGSIHCRACGHRRKHALQWPRDAYFAVGYRGHVLWALDRDSAIELNRYLLSTSRDLGTYRWRSLLARVPTVFKTRKARDVVSKRLLRLLSPTRRT